MAEYITDFEVTLPVLGELRPVVGHEVVVGEEAAVDQACEHHGGNDLENTVLPDF